MLRRHAATAILVILAGLVPDLASAQMTKAGIVTTLEGNVTVTRVAVAPQPLKFKDDVFIDDKITTGDRSLTRMLLGGKAVVTVREHSTLTITATTDRATIDLQNGKLALAVAKEKMRPGESIEVRTPNAIAGVRGTVLVVEVSRPSAQLGGLLPAVLTAMYWLRGFGDATLRDLATGAAVGTPVPIGPMTQIRVAGLAMGLPIPILPDQIPGIVAGFSSKPPHSNDEPAKENGANEFSQIADAALAGGLIGGGPITPPQPPQDNRPPIKPGNKDLPGGGNGSSGGTTSTDNCSYGSWGSHGSGSYSGYSGTSSSGGWRRSRGK